MCPLLFVNDVPHVRIFAHSFSFVIAVKHLSFKTIVTDIFRQRRGKISQIAQTTFCEIFSATTSTFKEDCSTGFKRTLNKAGAEEEQLIADDGPNSETVFPVEWTQTTLYLRFLETVSRKLQMYRE